MARRIISEKASTIQVVDRVLLPPVPGSAAPRHIYAPMFTVRASVKVSSGTNEFASVDIGGRKVSHTFTIRWTSIPFDSRHRVRDARGGLYQILNIVNVDDADRELRIQCASIGSDTQEAAL